LVCLFRNDYHLGRLLHVENVPASNARETNTKTFKDVNFKEEGFVCNHSSFILFGMYPKPITDLITPSLENILTHINRIN
jgi:NADH:ubiquinone oxidoreductase subunit 4 (subunit M)